MKKKKIKEVLEKTCTNKVKICTSTFCACGCFDEENSDDYIVAIKDAEITFNESKDQIEHKDSMCICDEHIIAFEPHV